MGVFNLAVLALFAVGSFAEQNNPNPTNDDSLYEGKKWVVLVAGSKGWSNYRHQANIFHAYQLIKSNGIPEENIITIMVDDIAYNQRNPKSGKIINKPEGPDVYNGVVIDYKGKDVRKSNFLKIITGDQEAMQSIGTEKVVKSGQNDKIFINFVAHSTTGLLGFPDDFLFADELNDAFNSMHGNGTYEEMLLYIEACDAGSIFDGILREDTNIIDSVFKNIYSEVVKARPDIKSAIGDYGEPNYLKLNLSVFLCYRSILNQITESCFSLPKNPYVLDKIKIFANMCVVDNQIHQMIGNIIIKSCSDVPDNIINTLVQHIV